MMKWNKWPEKLRTEFFQNSGLIYKCHKQVKFTRLVQISLFSSNERDSVVEIIFEMNVSPTNSSILLEIWLFSESFQSILICFSM